MSYFEWPIMKNLNVYKNGKPFNIDKTYKLKQIQDRHNKSFTSIN